MQPAESLRKRWAYRERHIKGRYARIEYDIIFEEGSGGPGIHVNNEPVAAWVVELHNYALEQQGGEMSGQEDREDAR
jgi:hypothetical protein